MENKQIDKHEIEKELENKITMIDEMETNAALELLNMKKNQYRKIYLIPLIILIPILIIALATHFNNLMSLFLFYSILAFVICLICYSNIIRPYERLLKLAEFNDKIRHEEKIRCKERERMSKVKTENVNRKNIQNSIKALQSQIDTKKQDKS